MEISILEPEAMKSAEEMTRVEVVISVQGSSWIPVLDIVSIPVAWGDCAYSDTNRTFGGQP
jgi:hypothetical protein